MDGGAWGAQSPWGHTESDTTEQLNSSKIILQAKKLNKPNQENIRHTKTHYDQTA